MMEAAIAFGTVFFGSMISPAEAAIAEKPKNVMNASAATERMSVDCPITLPKLPVNVAVACPGPAKLIAPPMNTNRTATFAAVTITWNVPDSSVPRAFSVPSRSAAVIPTVPWGSTDPTDSGRMNRKNHSSIVAR